MPARRIRPSAVPKQGRFEPFDGVYVICVGGGLRGPALARKLKELCDQSDGKARLAGLVADNPSIHPRKSKRIRYTCYKEFEACEDGMRLLAMEHELPLFYADIVSKQYLPDGDGFSVFERWLYEEALKVPLGKKVKVVFFMACFGQRWGKSTLKICENRFFNTHPVEHGSPWSRRNYCRGPVPYEKMHLRGAKQCDLVLHTIDNQFDVGLYVDRVGPYDLLPYDDPEMYFRRSNVKDGTAKCVKRKAQGEWVYNMHQRMCHATELLICNSFPWIIQMTLDGGKPTKNNLAKARRKCKVA